MPTQIERLAALQLIDQSLREKTRVIEESQGRVAALEASLQAQTGAAASARGELDAVTTRQRELETRLGGIETKVKDRRMRITRIRNEKELGLARREVDQLKDEQGVVETELLQAMEQVQASGAKLKGIEDEISSLETAMATEAAELRARIAELAGQIEGERHRREALIGTVDGELRRRYELIFSRRDGVAVVQIRSGTCQGCHMHVPPQLFNLIQRNEQVILCPNCQRMLYWRPEHEEEAS